MKKHILLFLSIFSLVTFSGCDERDEIRDDINALSARLDALQVEFDKLNDNISTFYNLATGKTYFTSYTQDEKGNYTLKLSDGTSWTVYGGLPEGDLPVITINEEGKWIFSYNGEEIELKDEAGNPATAFPVDGENGSTPKMSIGEDGCWYYQIGDGEPQIVPGPYNVAKVGKINPSIFDVVQADTEHNVLKFKLYGSDEFVDIALLGGLNMTFSGDNTTLSSSIRTLTFKATLTEVATVVISPTPFEVKLTDTGSTGSNKLTISIPRGSLVPDGEYTIYFEIYNESGYRLVKSLIVTVE